MALPLTANGQRIGALFLIATQPGRQFKLAEARPYDHFLNLMAAIIDARLKEAEVTDRLADTALLLEIAAITASFASLEDMLLRTLALVQRSLGVQQAMCLLYEHRTNHLYVPADAIAGVDLPPDGLTIPVDSPDNQLARTFMTGNIILSNQPERLRLPANLTALMPLHNLLCVPLRVQDTPLGLFLVTNRTDGLLHREDADLLTAIGSHVAAALRNDDLLTAIQERLLETVTLQRIAIITSATLNQDDMLTDALQETVDLLGVEAGMILTLDPGGQQLNVHRPSLWGIPSKPDYPAWPVDSYGHVVHAYHTGAPFYSNMDIDDPRLTAPKTLGIPIRNVITYPLNTRNRTLGVMTLLNKRDGLFMEEDLDLVKAVASQVAVSLESAQLFEGERARADLMSIVNEVSQELSFTLDLSALLDKTAHHIHDRLGYENVSILLTEETGDAIVLAAAASTNPQLAEAVGLKFPTTTGAVGQAIATGQTQYHPDVTESGDFYDADGLLQNIAASLTVPLRSGEQVIGAMDVATSQINGFSETDQIVMEMLAAQIATAIENANLFQQAQRQAGMQTFLRETTVKFSRAIVMDDLLAMIAAAAASTVQADYAVAALHPHITGGTTAIFPPDDDPPAFLITDLVESAFQTMPVLLSILHRPQTLLIQDGEIPPEAAAELAPYLKGDTATRLITPITQRQVLVGVLEVVVENSAAPIKAEAIALLEGVAQQAGIAVENVDLIEELETRAHELAEANRLKSEFLASISHELRTPMNSIIGFSETLLSGIYGTMDEKVGNRIERILRNGRNLLALIDDLLDISKIEAGKLELTIAPVSLLDALSTVLYTAESQITSKGLDIALDVPPDLPHLYVDSLRLNQILNNLLSNAIKFTHEGGITIHAGHEPNEGMVWCSVTDTGIGIAPESHTIIFDEFRQVDGTTTREYGGTGLGLAITKKLLMLMGGSIEVESTVDEGSRFTFWLPVAPFIDQT
jgi:signal transduction histidine kinase